MKYTYSLCVALALGGLLALPASVLAQAAPDMKTMASSADIQALIDKAKAMPPKPLISQNIVGATPYRANLEYRAGAPAPASIHDKDNELMYVIQGSATLTLGGTLVNGTRTNPTNQSGSSITGGVPNHIAKGDVIMVPAGTAHQVAPDSGVAIALMTFHVPSAWPQP
jgi:mannose-6-phosphate isomerase-like protein (cupin superfamily)